MTDPPTTSPVENHQDNLIPGPYPHPLSQLLQPHDSILQPALSKDKMKVGKSNSCPATPGELPPLVGVPHPRDKQRYGPPTPPESTTIPEVCRGALESETPPGPGASSPLNRRRLKYMVRQHSDSELLKNNLALGRLKITPPTSANGVPMPHPPDSSPRSQNSSETNSPQIFRKPPLLNSSRSGPTRRSRSLEASPMVVRRFRGGAVRHNSGEQESPSSVPPSPPGTDQGHKRQPRPLSFGSFSDVLHYVGSNTDPSQNLTASPRGPGSPFVARRTVSLRGDHLPSSSRPDTPANDALSVHDSKKSYQLPTSSGERNEFEDKETSLVVEDCADLDETDFPRRRLPADFNRNTKKSQHATTPSGVNGYQLGPHYPHEETGSDDGADDDTGYPSNLYDIQERRESILSIEACQEIARRFTNNDTDSCDESKSEEDEGDKNQNLKKKAVKKETVPEYRKGPLPTEIRVSNWLKGLQDPTERASSNLERILPDIRQ